MSKPSKSRREADGSKLVIESRKIAVLTGDEQYFLGFKRLVLRHQSA